MCHFLSLPVFQPFSCSTVFLRSSSAWFSLDTSLASASPTQCLSWTSAPSLFSCSLYLCCILLQIGSRSKWVDARCKWVLEWQVYELQEKTHTLKDFYWAQINWMKVKNCNYKAFHKGKVTKSWKVSYHYVCCHTAVMSCVFMCANSGCADLARVFRLDIDLDDFSIAPFYVWGNLFLSSKCNRLHYHFPSPLCLHVSSLACHPHINLVCIEVQLLVQNLSSPLFPWLKCVKTAELFRMYYCKEKSD